MDFYLEHTSTFKSHIHIEFENFTFWARHHRLENSHCFRKGLSIKQMSATSWSTVHHNLMCMMCHCFTDIPVLHSMNLFSDIFPETPNLQFHKSLVINTPLLVLTIYSTSRIWDIHKLINFYIKKHTKFSYFYWEYYGIYTIYKWKLISNVYIQCINKKQCYNNSTIISLLYIQWLRKVFNNSQIFLQDIHQIKNYLSLTTKHELKCSFIKVNPQFV